MKLILGVGINDKTYPSFITSIKQKTDEYCLWYDMLKRCYNKKYLERTKTYHGCSINNNFLNYTYFYEWCNRQIGFGLEGWQLDKDILIKGNKIYSETACAFVPMEINTLFTKTTSKRGIFPIGVYYNKEKGKFVAQCNFNIGSQTYLGSFNTPLEAFDVYKKHKELYIKQVADKYKAVIDHRVYEAMYHYEVEITD